MPFCSINIASSVFTMKIKKIKIINTFKYPDNLNNPHKQKYGMSDTSCTQLFVFGPIINTFVCFFIYIYLYLAVEN